MGELEGNCFTEGRDYLVIICYTDKGMQNSIIQGEAGFDLFPELIHCSVILRTNSPLQLRDKNSKFLPRQSLDNFINILFVEIIFYRTTFQTFWYMIFPFWQFFHGNLTKKMGSNDGSVGPVDEEIQLVHLRSTSLWIVKETFSRISIYLHQSKTLAL